MSDGYWKCLLCGKGFEQPDKIDGQTVAGVEVVLVSPCCQSMHIRQILTAEQIDAVVAVTPNAPRPRAGKGIQGRHVEKVILDEVTDLDA